MHLLSLSVVLLSAAVLDAQGDVVRTAFGLWHEGPSHQTLCGGGPDYRVEFELGGAAYVPALPDAPRLYPVRFEFASLKRGGDTITSGQPVLADRDGDTTARYDRTPDLVERYELSAKGVEQCFELARRPAGHGDVVVRQRLVTDLVAERTGDCSDGLRLSAPDGYGGVELGVPVAIDADGARTPMAMHFDGTWLELRIDHAAVDAAAYPLVLDPLIGTLHTVSSANGDAAPDAAWDETSQRYLVVWRRPMSLSVSEVFGRLYDEDVIPTSSVLPLATGTAFATNPTVSSVVVRGRFCVVWQEGSSSGPFSLYCRAVDGQSGSTSAQVTVAASTGKSSHIDPDLASEIGTDDEAVLVWNVEGQSITTRGITLLATGDPIPHAQTTLLSSSGSASRPAISKGGGSGGIHVVVWQEAASVQGTAIKAMAMTRDGTPLSSPITISSGSTQRSQRRQAPDVDGDGQNFMVVYELEEGVNAGQYDIYCRRISWDGASASLSTTNLAAPVSNYTGDEVTPAVALVGKVFLVAWAIANPVVPNSDILMRTIDATGVVCGQQHAPRQTAFVNDKLPAIGSQTSGGGNGERALLVFDFLDITSQTKGIGAQLFEAFGDDQQVVIGQGCGLGGMISTSGPMAVGNLGFSIDLKSADPAATATLLSVGLPSPTLPCGGCTLTNPLVTAPVAINNGNASLPLPLSCSLSSAGQILEFQWVTLGSVVNACPQVPILSVSGRLQATLTH